MAAVIALGFSHEAGAQNAVNLAKGKAAKQSSTGFGGAFKRLQQRKMTRHDNRRLAG